MTTTYIEKAIKKAVEEGWRPKGLVKTEGRHISWIKQAAVSRSFHIERYWIDPLFWQAVFKEYRPGRTFYMHWRGKPQWYHEMHRFIDHLAEGKEAEEFFKSLINNDE